MGKGFLNLSVKYIDVNRLSERDILDRTYEMVNKFNHELFQKLTDTLEIAFRSIDNSRLSCISEHS